MREVAGLDLGRVEVVIYARQHGRSLDILHASTTNPELTFGLSLHLTQLLFETPQLDLGQLFFRLAIVVKGGIHVRFEAIPARDEFSVSRLPQSHPGRCDSLARHCIGLC